MDGLYKRIGRALGAEFGDDMVYAGPTPADAGSGAVYYAIEKYAGSGIGEGGGGDETAALTVRARYFTGGLPSVSDGARLSGALCGMGNGALMTLLKYECRLCSRYAETTAVFTLPLSYLGGVQGGVQGEGEGEGGKFGELLLTLRFI